MNIDLITLFYMMVTVCLLVIIAFYIGCKFSDAQKAKKAYIKGYRKGHKDCADEMADVLKLKGGAFSD